MPKYEVKMLVEFSGELEAESPEAAEKLAWTSWGDTMDKEITYDNVDSIEIQEIEDYEEDEEEEDLFQLNLLEAPADSGGGFYFDPGGSAGATRPKNFFQNVLDFSLGQCYF